MLPVVLVSPSEHLSFIQAAGDKREAGKQLEKKKGKRRSRHFLMLTAPGQKTGNTRQSRLPDEI